MLGLIAADESVLLYPLIVLSGLVQLTADAPDGAQWRERLCRLYWLYQQATPRLPGASDANISGADYIRLIADAGEFDAMCEVLRRHRIPLQPPADWLPQEARHRALVTTGVVTTDTKPPAAERGR